MSTQDHSKTSSSASQNQSPDSSSMVTSTQSPSSTVKRQPRWLVSAEIAEQLKRDFASELILTMPGLSGPVAKPHKSVDGEDK
jgi:hypothetical protein